ncbi:MAG: hypothetical protein RL722_1217 [Pseudomonadota bacterium]|jgi:predicted aminopeptidase
MRWAAARPIGRSPLRRVTAAAAAAALAAAAPLLLGGCAAPPAGSAAAVTPDSALGYYWQSFAGHVAMLQAARPVSAWIADPATPPVLRARLEQAEQLRDFGVRELALPDNASYRRYADLQRASVVWNVVATPELSLTLETWCFPVLGCVGYRGYFDEARARALGERLRAAGFDVKVYGVPAYSTLGKLPVGLLPWTADPLLNTFIDYPTAELARMVFHELAHQVVYAEGDTLFNESFATAVERLGAAAWLARHGSAAERESYARVQARRAQFQGLTRDYRQRMEALYAGPGDAAAKRAGKAALIAELRAEHQRLKAGPWAGYAGYDEWFATVNNAALGVLAAYTARVVAFEAVFEAQGRSFPRFYAEVGRLAALPPAERQAALDQWQGRTPPALPQ